MKNKLRVYVVEERDENTLEWVYCQAARTSRADGNEALAGRRAYLQVAFGWSERKARLMTRLAVYEYARPA